MGYGLAAMIAVLVACTVPPGAQKPTPKLTPAPSNLAGASPSVPVLPTVTVTAKRPTKLAKAPCSGIDMGDEEKSVGATLDCMLENYK